MSLASNPSAGTAIYEALTIALRSTDRTIQESAAKALYLIGPGIVKLLLADAVSCKRSVRHRVRLLQVVEEIGEVSEGSDMLTLFALTNDKRQEVAEAACRAMGRLRASQEPCAAD